jgi:hypothetical protein
MDPEIYIRNMEELGIVNRWNEIQMLCYFRLALRGAVASWINTEDPAESWNELIKKFRELFVDNGNEMTIIKDMIKMEFNGEESLLGFLDRINGLSKRVGLTEDVLIAMTIQNLSDDMGKLIIATCCAFTTL